MEQRTDTKEGADMCAARCALQSALADVDQLAAAQAAGAAELVELHATDVRDAVRFALGELAKLEAQFRA